VELSGRKISTGISADDATEAITEQLKKHPEFEKIGNELYEYQNALIDYAYQKGLISEKGKIAMRELNKIPRAVLPGDGGKHKGRNKSLWANGLATRRQFSKNKGSEREIVDPLEGIIKDTYAIIKRRRP